MSKVVSTKQQLEKLVSLMEENPQLTKGICSKIQAAKKWEEIAVELNCLGPPVRTTTKWIKVWADMKSKTKKKVTENRAEYRATGGGPNKLHVYTNIEEAIIGVLRLNSCVNLPGTEFGLDIIDEEPWEVLVGTSATSPKNEPIENLEMDHNFAGRIDKPRKKMYKD